MNVFIIAEIGINHNGDIKLAKKMIETAKKCGAHAVKFQKRDIKLVYSKEILAQKRESPWGNTQYDQKKGLEFDKREYDEINDFCKKLGIIWFASIPALSVQIPSQAFLTGCMLGLLAYGTYEFTNFATLRGWSLQMVAVDVAWGALLTGTSAWAGVTLMTFIS